MKKIILLVAVLTTVVAVKAQDCRALVLPKFNYDTVRLDDCPMNKVNYFCAYARSAFYESDTLPAGVDVYAISDVINKQTGEALPNSYVVDLNTLSYYGYNFINFHTRYSDIYQRVAFSTPESTHPYLIMRSIKEMLDTADATYETMPLE